MTYILKALTRLKIRKSSGNELTIKEKSNKIFIIIVIISTIVFFIDYILIIKFIDIIKTLYI